MKEINYKITIKSIVDYEEIISSLLFDNGANGVVIDDNKTLLDSIKDKSNWDYLDVELIKRLEIRDNTIIVSGFFDEDVSDNLKSQIYEFCEFQKISTNSFDISLTIEQCDMWLDNHKKYFEPIIFDKIVVLPEWVKESFVDKTVVKLNHVVAFGTGQHESTAMCIELIEQLNLLNKKVIDIGCGTGILGIVASLLGGIVTFVDCDSVAIDATKSNIDLNKIVDYKCIQSSLLDNISDKFDIVLANLTADLLGMLASKIQNNINNNAIIVVSGIINDRALEVKATFEQNGYEITKSLTKGEWTAFVLKESMF